MPLTVGGGVRTVDDIRKLLTCGADKVSINTAAVSRRAFVKEAAEKFGDQCIVVAIDAKKVSKPGEPARWEIFTHGGRNPTGLDAVDYAREVVALGAGEILLTSMDRDGTRSGFDIPLTRAIADAVPVPVIASGGVGTLDHLVEGIRDGHATRGAGGLDLPFRRAHRARRPRPTWPRPACRCGSIRSGRRVSAHRGCLRAMHAATPAGCREVLSQPHEPLHPRRPRTARARARRGQRREVLHPQAARPGRGALRQEVRRGGGRDGARGGRRGPRAADRGSRRPALPPAGGAGGARHHACRGRGAARDAAPEVRPGREGVAAARE